MTTRDIDLFSTIWDASPLLFIIFAFIALILVLSRFGLIDLSFSHKGEKDELKELRDEVKKLELEVIDVRLQLAELKGAREAQHRKDTYDGHS